MKPMEGMASTTVSSSITKSRCRGSGRTGCWGPKGMTVFSAMGGLGRRGHRLLGSHCLDERGLLRFHVEIAFEIQRQAFDLHAEEVLQFVLIDEGRQVAAGDAGQG